MPLLIGGATTSRAHTALKIDPHYKSPTVWVKDASRAVGVAQSLVSRRPARGLRRGERRRLRGDPRAPPQPRRCQARWCRWTRRARRRSTAAGTTTTPPGAAPARHHGVRRLPARRTACRTSTGRRSSTPGNWRAAIRRSSTTPSSARRRASCSPMRRRCSKQIVDEKWLQAKAVVGLWPAQSVGDDVRARRTATTLHFLRQQVDKPADRPDFCLADFIAPAGSGQAGLDRRLRGDRRPRHRAARRALRSRPRRLPRDPAQGARRSPGRSARRTPARSACAREILGLCGGRDARQRGADRREVPRHPPCPRLSGLPRAQREGDAVRAARCGEATRA